MNTTGNSSPLALCSVISVTRPRSSSIASWSVYNEISCRNADIRDDSSTCSPRWSNSRATPTSSRRFSSRPCDSIVRSASSISA